MNAAQELNFTFVACADVRGIWQALSMPTDMWGRTADRNMARAEAFSRDFTAHCELLGRHPDLGVARDELHHGVRSSPFQKYVIYYRARAGRLEILRVLRASWQFAFPA